MFLQKKSLFLGIGEKQVLYVRIYLILVWNQPSVEFSRDCKESTTQMSVNVCLACFCSLANTDKICLAIISANGNCLQLQTSASPRGARVYYPASAIFVVNILRLGHLECFCFPLYFFPDILYTFFFLLALLKFWVFFGWLFCCTAEPFSGPLATLWCLCIYHVPDL